MASAQGPDIIKAVRTGTDFLAFRRVSNILDLAVAAAECAAALEAEFDRTSEAIVCAKEFFKHVRYGMSNEDGAAPISRIDVGGYSQLFDTRHSQYLREAEEVWQALATDGTGSKSERFREHHERLAQRIREGVGFEAEHAL